MPLRIETNLKDEVLGASKRWFAEIADLQAEYPLMAIMHHHNSGNNSKELNDFFTDNGLKLSEELL